MNTTSDRYDAGVALAWRRAELERAIIVAMLRSRRRGMASAREAGVTVKLFDQPDLAALFDVIEATTERPIDATLRIARGLLEQLNYFDDTVPRGSRGMHWSCKTLAEAAACTGPEMDYAAAVLPTLFDELKNIVNASRRREAA